jgi:hypothetical protein
MHGMRLRPTSSAFFNTFWSLDFQSFYLLNQTYMVLLRKKQDAATVVDFRPISLIHSFNKLVAKTLSMRLSLFMDELVMPNQSPFICGRAIHDNFRAVQSTTKLLHVRKRSTILMKVDIAKAFDTVNRAFLFGLMSYGFLSSSYELDLGPPLFGEHSHTGEWTTWAKNLPCSGAVAG